MMNKNPSEFDVIIIGAGAAGLMCAMQASKRGRKVLVLESANKAGKKILMSGGGRCNFTNLEVSAENFISNNPHFCKSALSQYTQWDFIALVNEHGIEYEERDLGKLFCIHSAKDILTMLLSECEQNGVQIQLNCHISNVVKDEYFSLLTSTGSFQSNSLVVACGGLSIPTMGASAFGYQIAEQFGHLVMPTRAGLVPFTLQPQDKKDLAGIAVKSLVSTNDTQFDENVLFTHRGLSGPGILQLSSYWQLGDSVSIKLESQIVLESSLNQHKEHRPQTTLKTALTELYPKRLVLEFVEPELINQPLQSLSDRQLANIAGKFQNWQFKPSGTEGYRTAEVTLGGVDCNALSSKTMQSQLVPNLYFIGEVIDVTGWLGGYNFQWAWSSGWCAGQAV